jgi:ATP-binding cassette, subfamily F, member 3
VISVSNMSLNFGDREIFSQVGFQISEKDAVGLVGRNGAGKSTLLKILAGEIKAGSGDISRPLGVSVGYLPQELQHNSNETVFNEVAKALSEQMGIAKRIDEIQHAFDEGVEDQDLMSDLLEEFNNLSHHMQLLDAQSADERIERILKGLGFTREEFDKPLSQFSGGWKMRVELAKILLTSPDLLLLDEPTNHLDIDSIQWLEDFLKTYSGAIVMISHDVTFLDSITTRTLEVVNGKIRDYKASYTKYLEQRKLIVERQKQEAQNQEKYVKNTQDLINKFRAKSSKAAFAQNLIKKLDKLEEVEVDEDEIASLNLNLGQVARSGKVALTARNLSKSFGTKHLFSNVSFELERGEKVALIGKNGIGKTTLLKILVGEEPSTGTVELGHNVAMGYFAQHQSSTLNGELTVFDVIDQEATGEMRPKIRALLGAFLFSGDSIHKKVKVLSGGEKNRLAMCRLMLKSHNFLIMDEPTNHLDIDSKKILKEALQRFEGALLVVSHDRDFLQGLTSKIFEIQAGGLQVHLEDMNSFLAQRNARNIAEFEHEQKKTQTSKSTSYHADFQDKKRQEKEKKQLQNRISKLEIEIMNLEKKIGELNEVAASLDFSNQEAVRKSFEEITKVKQQLEEKETAWSEAVGELETFSE